MAANANVPGTPSSSGTKPQGRLWKAYAVASGAIGAVGGATGFTGKTGFSAAFVSAAIFAALLVIACGVLAAVEWVKRNTEKKRHTLHFTIPLAVGISLMFLAAGTGFAYAWNQDHHATAQSPCPSCGPNHSAAPPGRPSATASRPSAPPPSSPPPPPVAGGPGAPLRLTDTNKVEVQGVAFDPAGGTLAVADLNSRVFFYSSPGGSYKSDLQAPNHQPLWTVAYSPDGSMVAVGTGTGQNSKNPADGYNDGSLYVWRPAKSPQPFISVKDPDDGLIEPVAFSPSGQDLAWGDNNGAVYLYDLRTGTDKALETSIPDAPGQNISGLSFSSNGLLAASATNGEVYLWTVATGRPYGSPLQPASSTRANGVAFGPGGSTLAIADTTGPPSAPAGSVDLWSLATGDYQAFPSPANVPVQAVAFVPGGKYLIGAADSNTVPGGPQASAVLVWNVATGRQAGPLLRDFDTDGTGPLAVSPDGKILAVADGNASTFLWSLSWLR
ncbi:MAG TPA: WD40 repeat domain-containing protein [Trebonia sp.]|jgi:WD40 repeat protein|nr:WD40 repeat domain-containing protein [Trebonia sp.]